MNNTLNQNIAALRDHYPELADRIEAFPDKDRIISFQAKDGGLAYGLRSDKGIRPLTDAENPITRIGDQLNSNSAALSNFSRPVMLVGLYPGDELLYIFDLSEKEDTHHAAQKIYVAVDSIACLYGFLQNMDAREVISSERVTFFPAEKSELLAGDFKANTELSYLFTLISGSPSGTVNKVMQPFVNLVQERNEETARFIKENETYYQNQTNEELANTIAGKGTRPPRIMTVASSFSTVTQYSCRDLCAAMEKEGWQSRQLILDNDPTPHYMASQIHEFKPDIFLFANHLRTEALSVYPTNMMFVTWVQDTIPHVNRQETAEEWNKMSSHSFPISPAPSACSARDNLEPPSPLPALSDLPVEHHPNSPTQHPTTTGSRNRDLIIGYTGQLKKYGYAEERLCEMPMIVNTNIFKPRELTPEQIEKYGCDVMFASNSSKPTDQIVREILVPKFSTLEPGDSGQWTVDSESPSPSSPITVHPSSSVVNNSSLKPTTQQPDKSTTAPLFSESLLIQIHDHLWEQYRAGRTFATYAALEKELLSLSSSPSLPSRPPVQTSQSSPPSADGDPTPQTLPEVASPLSPDISAPSGSRDKDAEQRETIPNSVHLCSSVVSFSASYATLSPDDRDFVIQQLFWQLNDVIYRHVVLEWLDKLANGQLSVNSSSDSSPTAESMLYDLRSIVSPDAHRIKIHLYGRGWENHPRFAKYAKGELRHGEELSIAYQAAKHCLHLNAMEGGHQRFREILSSTGNILCRRSVIDSSASICLNSAIRKLFATREPLSKNEFHAWNDYIFVLATQALRASHDLPLEHLRTQVEHTVYQRLIQNPEWMLTALTSHGFAHARSLNDSLSKPTVERKNVHAALSTVILVEQLISTVTALLGTEFQFRHTLPNLDILPATQFAQLLKDPDIDPEKLIQSFEQIKEPSPRLYELLLQKLIATGRNRNATRICESLNPDDLTDQLLPIYTYLLATEGRFEKARSVIANAYSANADLKDLHANIAWRHFWAMKEYHKTIEWMHYDKRDKRLSPARQLQLASAYAATRQMSIAERTVLTAYAEDPDINNGFALASWQRFVQYDFAYEKTLPYFKKDMLAGRISGPWLLNYAQALAACDRDADAKTLIDAAYRDDHILANGYARCSWIRYFYKYFKPSQALKGFEKDLSLNRLREQSKISHAIIVAILGDIDAALSIIDRTYKEYPGARDGHANIAWYHHVLNKAKHRESLLMLRQDSKSYRLTHQAKLIEAAIHASDGDYAFAERIIAATYKEAPFALGGYTLAGAIRYRNDRDIASALATIRKDHILNRAPHSFLKYVYAQFLFKAGYSSEACSLLAEANRCDHVELYAVSWLHRIGYDRSLTKTLLSQKPEYQHGGASC